VLIDGNQVGRPGGWAARAETIVGGRTRPFLLDRPAGVDLRTKVTRDRYMARLAEKLSRLYGLGDQPRLMASEEHLVRPFSASAPTPPPPA